MVWVATVLCMASVRERRRSDGTRSFAVRRRDPDTGRDSSPTYDDERHARVAKEPIETAGGHADGAARIAERKVRWSATRLTGLAIVTLTLACGCGVGDSPPTPDGPLVRSMELQPGESATAAVSTHCGYEWLEVVINGETWTTTELGSDDAGNSTEPAWPHGQQAELVLNLVDDDELEVTAVGTEISHTYLPASRPSGCE